MDNNELLSLVIDNLNDHSANDLITLDVTGMTDITDTIIICSGTSSRHVQTLCEKVVEAIKQHYIKPLGIETDPGNEWTLVDLGDIIIHIMQPETREKYSLEKLWAKVGNTREKGNH